MFCPPRPVMEHEHQPSSMAFGVYKSFQVHQSRSLRPSVPERQRPIERKHSPPTVLRRSHSHRSASPCVPPSFSLLFLDSSPQSHVLPSTTLSHASHADMVKAKLPPRGLTGKHLVLAVPLVVFPPLVAARSP
ncbi:hypothetical protein BDR22DRAFT_835579 [Usnea florida]